MNTNHTLGIGYFSSSTISFIHLEDLALALILGFAGSAGAYIFKLIVERNKR